jgi:hypothetical protein
MPVIASLSTSRGFDDFETAVATYKAATLRWPKAKITLRQGARVVIKNWRE